MAGGADADFDVLPRRAGMVDRAARAARSRSRCSQDECPLSWSETSDECSAMMAFAQGMKSTDALAARPGRRRSREKAMRRRFSTRKARCSGRFAEIEENARARRRIDGVLASQGELVADPNRQSSGLAGDVARLFAPRVVVLPLERRSRFMSGRRVRTVTRRRCSRDVERFRRRRD